MTGPRELLEAQRAEAVRRLAALHGDVAGIVEASRDSNADDEHDPDGATIAFERAQLGALVRAATQQLAQIDEALGRLDDGTYGTCVRCGRPIGAERLVARPAARECIDCARR
ncbi:TraR/DksA family transcriptional regulator [Oerskovia flava]|uniref:TraR/DksA family transcriptional regulator n=1 Tax=Oerskovia flava TaxID=2986422 RepID=UPI00223EBE05|nr:TraR/DksA C4-type zinc finger protein [Oerskovia sp. JB1-3-2]